MNHLKSSKHIPLRDRKKGAPWLQKWFYLPTRIHWCHHPGRLTEWLGDGYLPIHRIISHTCPSSYFASSFALLRHYEHFIRDAAGFLSVRSKDSAGSRANMGFAFTGNYVGIMDQQAFSKWIWLLSALWFIPLSCLQAVSLAIST